MARKEVEELELSLVRLAEQLGRAVLGPDGKEYVSSRPVEAPIGLRVPRSTVEVMRDMIRREMSAAAETSGFETWEEADDFDVEDDPMDPHTPYEAIFDGPLPGPDAPEGASPEGGSGGPPPGDKPAGGGREPSGGGSAGGAPPS